MSQRLKAGESLERITGLAREWKLTNLQPQINACRGLLDRSNGLDVAVFGRFKAGKSSFLNHLSGRDVLPIGVVPLTAVITKLRHGERDRALVRFLNGATKDTPLDKIGSYVGENENPGNRKEVAAVEVELPELAPLAPLQFVDTPGLGSAFAHNTEAALNWLPNAGAALVAVSADAPLSERDLDLLGGLRRHTPKIVLLLTKADLLTEAQRAGVRAFVRDQLRRKWKDDLPVFFYSIKPELETMKSALLAELLLPLRQHRDEAGEQIFRHKLASLCNETLNYLRVALAAGTQAEAAREALRKTLDEERRHFGLFREELQVMTREWSAKALDQSLERLQPVQRALQAKVTSELQAQFPRWRLRLPQFLDAWRGWLQAFLSRELAEVSHSQRFVFCVPAQKAATHLARTFLAFHDRLAGHVQAALGVSLPPGEFNLDVREPSAPPVDVAFAFDVTFTTLGWLIPRTLLHKPIERALLRKARYEVEKNLSRLAADWGERVGVVVEELRQQTEQAAWNELETLSRMAAQTASNVPRLREQISELEKMSVAWP
jgi:GTP-binding protein EngB required for normal cell division